MISQKYESDEILFESLEDDRCFYLSGLIYLVLARLFLIRNNIGLLEQDLGNIRELCV